MDGRESQLAERHTPAVCPLCRESLTVPQWAWKEQFCWLCVQGQGQAAGDEFERVDASSNNCSPDGN